MVESSATEKVARTAEAVLSCELGIIEACRIIAPLLASVVPELNADIAEIFFAVDSETDDVPVGSIRSHWESNALAARDEDDELRLYEQGARTEVEESCRALLRALRA